MSYEVEQKFLVDDPEALQNRLIELGASPSPSEQHSDTYYNHPCRDFSETHEALRIRRINKDIACVNVGTAADAAAMNQK